MNRCLGYTESRAMSGRIFLDEPSPIDYSHWCQDAGDKQTNKMCLGSAHAIVIITLFSYVLLDSEDMQ